MALPLDWDSTVNYDVVASFRSSLSSSSSRRFIALIHWVCLVVPTLTVRRVPRLTSISLTVA